MTQGVLLFAFNSPKYNYYEMALHTKKRVEHFLKLPVTLVTDEDSIPADYENHGWDQITFTTPERITSVIGGSGSIKVDIWPTN